MLLMKVCDFLSPANALPILVIPFSPKTLPRICVIVIADATTSPLNPTSAGFSSILSNIVSISLNSLRPLSTSSETLASDFNSALDGVKSSGFAINAPVLSLNAASTETRLPSSLIIKSWLFSRRIDLTTPLGKWTWLSVPLTPCCFRRSNFNFAFSLACLSTVLNSWPATRSPVLKSWPATRSPVLKSWPATRSPVLKFWPATRSPVLKFWPPILSPVLKSWPATLSPVVNFWLSFLSPVLKSWPPILSLVLYSWPAIRSVRLNCRSRSSRSSSANRCACKPKDFCRAGLLMYLPISLYMSPLVTLRGILTVWPVPGSCTVVVCPYKSAKSFLAAPCSFISAISPSALPSWLNPCPTELSGGKFIAPGARKRAACGLCCILAICWLAACCIPTGPPLASKPDKTGLPNNPSLIAIS